MRMSGLRGVNRVVTRSAGGVNIYNILLISASLAQPSQAQPSHIRQPSMPISDDVLLLILQPGDPSRRLVSRGVAHTHFTWHFQLTIAVTPSLDSLWTLNTFAFFRVFKWYPLNQSRRVFYTTAAHAFVFTYPYLVSSIVTLGVNGDKANIMQNSQHDCKQFLEE